jgi:hypothetical protein
MFLIVIAIILLVILIIYVTVTPRNAASLAKLNQQQTTQSDIEHKNDLSEIPKIINPEQPKANTQQNEALSEDTVVLLKEELKPHKYHSDPYIEAHSILSENGMCFVVDNSDKGETHIKKYFIASNRLSEFETIMNNCQSVLQSYPTLANNMESIYWNLEPNSSIGHKLQNMFKQQLKGISDRDNNSQTLIATLKSKTAP